MVEKEVVVKNGSGLHARPATLLVKKASGFKSDVSIEYNGKKAGVYKTEEGETFVVSTKCPHLGCELKWNADELTWDCPCHGSRFDYKGKLLDNPSINNLTEELHD